MANVKLKNIKKDYGKNTVISNLNLEIEDGSFCVLVGPSGCGKSTILRMIAGLEEVTEGTIFIGDEDVTHKDPGKRNIAMVFQNYALYPTMSVRENIEFGLKNKKVPKAERDQLLKEITQIVGLQEYLDRKPSKLSGGQRQRVALARAMVKKPTVFLMDEPLSNLDAKLRSEMRSELIRLHKKLGVTFVYVTHDQTEAMSMGDEIVVLNQGIIQQQDNPMQLYFKPKNLFTAQFIGAPAMNIVKTKKGYIGFRPENVNTKSKDFEFSATIKTKEMLGAEVIYCLEALDKEFYMKSSIMEYQVGENMVFGVEQKNIQYFDEKGYLLENANE